MIVANACLKITALLAQSMDKNFSSFIKGMLPNIMKGMKDKKTLVGAQNLLLAFSNLAKAEDYLDEIKDALNDKSPAIRVNVCKWVEQNVLPNCSSSVLKKLISTEFYTTLIKLTDEATGEVRDAAIGCMSIFFAKLGVEDPDLKKSTVDFNQQKQEKLTKMIAVAKAKFPQEPIPSLPERRTPPPPCSNPMPMSDTLPFEVPEKQANAVRKSNPKGKINRQNSSKVIPANNTTAAPSKFSGPRPGTAATQTHHRVASKAPQAKLECDEESFEEMSIEDAEKALASGINIPSQITTLCEGKDWKERQKGLQELNEWVSSQIENLKNLLEPFSVYFKKKIIKDFKESNQSILKEGFTLLQMIFTAGNATKKIAHIILPGLCEKLSDTKWTENIYTIILLISDSAGPTYCVNLIIKSINANTKNLNLIKASLTLLGNMLTAYSAALLPLKPIVDTAKTSLAHANKQIRESATQLLCVVYSFTGESIKQLLNDLKPALLQVIEGEFKKTTLKTPAEAAIISRQLKGDAGKPCSMKKVPISAADALIPRVNISSQVSSKILEKLSDKSMKVKQEGKEEIEKILAGANNRIEATGLSSLMSVMKAKMNEPSKALAKNFISLLGNLAKAMGNGMKQYAKLILPSLISNLGDKQAYIRTETCNSMNSFADAVGSEVIINACAPMLEDKNPDLRTEILKWIVIHKKEINKADCPSLVTGLISGLQDRSKEIRAMSCEIVEAIGPIVGMQLFMNGIQDLKPTVKTSLSKMIERLFIVAPAKTPEKNLPDQLVSEPMIIGENAKMNERPATAAPAMARPEPMQDNQMVASDKSNKQPPIESIATVKGMALTNNNNESNPPAAASQVKFESPNQTTTPGNDKSSVAAIKSQTNKIVSPCPLVSYTSPAKSQSSSQSLPSSTLSVETVIITVVIFLLIFLHYFYRFLIHLQKKRELINQSGISLILKTI